MEKAQIKLKVYLEKQAKEDSEPQLQAHQKILILQKNLK